MLAIPSSWQMSTSLPARQGSKWGAALPRWPGGHAKLTGTITLDGIKRSPGKFDLVIHLPIDSEITATEDIESDRGNEAAIGPKTEDPNTRAPEWLLSFKTLRRCDRFFGMVAFTIKSNELAYGQGWGRQRIKVPYFANSGQPDATKAVDHGAAEQCDYDKSSDPGALTLTTSGHQQIAQLTASPDRGRGAYGWPLPQEAADSLVVEATIENSTTRYFANLATNVLFLGIGALLGAFSLREGGRS
jgi:hypothetical protein